MNISVPDALAEEVRQQDIPVSAVCQRALCDEVSRRRETEPASEASAVAVIDQVRQGLDYIRTTYGGGAVITERGKRNRPVSETAADVIAVIDQTGRHHNFNADDWYVRNDGHVELTKGGKDAKPVASFAPGFLGVYKVAARAGAPVVQAA